MSSHWTDDPLYDQPNKRKVRRMQRQLDDLRERAARLPEVQQHKYLPVLDKLDYALQHQSQALFFVEEVIEDLGAMLPKVESTGEPPSTPTPE